jgi:hypothetical protein
MSWNPNSVSTANEASLFINAIAWVAEAGMETAGEIERLKTYYTEFYGQFGYEFIEKLKDRIRDGSFSKNTANRLDSSQGWDQVWGAPGHLVPGVDSPVEAGFLMNAMCWVSEDGGFANVEYERIRSYFDEYNQKFGDYFRQDLRDRIGRGELLAETMNNVAPGWGW